MRTVILIPARFASARYPGKPLAELRGPDGPKSLVRRSWEAARGVAGAAEVMVATDDERIRAHAEGFGARVAMTSPDCANGTERCADAVARHGIEADLIVNFQGDAPLTPPDFVEALIGAMAGAPDAAIATPVLRCDATAYAHFRADRAAGRVGATTAVFDAAGRALYFSKEIIPHISEARAATAHGDVFHHVGLYAYRPAALAAYPALPVGRLERHEGLEQLRFMENGYSVACVEVSAGDRPFWELNNPEDVARIEEVLNR